MILAALVLAVVLAVVVIVWTPTSAVPMLVSLVSAAGLAVFCTWAVLSLDRGRG
jgi:hypothetical protein